MSDTPFVLAGVMGWPVAHTRSPAIHNHWIDRYALKGAYVQLPVHPDHLEAAIRGLPALGFAGCNVTVPHKESAMHFMDELHPVAKRVAAINTIVVQPDGRLLGMNNDGAGYIQSLRDADPLLARRCRAGPGAGCRRCGAGHCGGLAGRGRALTAHHQPHAGAGTGAGQRLWRPGQGAAVVRSS